MPVPEPDIVTCEEWGAVRPKFLAAVSLEKPRYTIFHHTAGLGGSDPKAYARALQRYHMQSNGWSDSGHNFLVMKDGTILEGRHGSIVAIRQGRMIVSAHCRGHNHEPGVEHEHLHEGEMTRAQFSATVGLHAWFADRLGIEVENLAHGHGDFNPTSCPGELRADLPRLRKAVLEMLLTFQGKVPLEELRKRTGYYAWAAWRLGEGDWKAWGPQNPLARPAVPTNIVLKRPTWFPRLVAQLASRLKT